jgi:hypothetical protein
MSHIFILLADVQALLAYLNEGLKEVQKDVDRAMLERLPVSFPLGSLLVAVLTNSISPWPSLESRSLNTSSRSLTQRRLSAPWQ